MAKLWNDILIEHLKNKKEALAYFNAALEDTKDGSEESQKLLFIALSNIVKAQGGFSEFSEKSGLNRESLYKSLSKKGNPQWSTIQALLTSMGFELKARLITKR